MSFYDIDLVTINGKPQKMDVYRGKMLLIVNVASQCGFTPQYSGLQTLYATSKDRGSEKPGILGTEAIKWNFTKFLVDSDGTVLKRYAPNDKPEAILFSSV
jgi:glutathione peroxidase